MLNESCLIPLSFPSCHFAAGGRGQWGKLLAGSCKSVCEVRRLERAHHRAEAKAGDLMQGGLWHPLAKGSTSLSECSGVGFQCLIVCAAGC